jgi:hypothetical protein
MPRQPAPVYVRDMRKRWVVVLVLLVWWIRRDRDLTPASHPHAPQAAVLSDGFGVLADKRIREFDRAGNVTHDMPLRLEHGNVRFVGTSHGAAVGWRDDKRFKLAILDGDGNPREPSVWGRNVKQLCDGAASNEHRFGIAFLEGDGAVWFIHGPMNGFSDGRELVETSVTNPTWCGIASARESIVLLWRDGQRLLMNFCTRKQCDGLAVRVQIDVKDTLLGYGCVQDSCLFASRDKHGTTKLLRVTNKGRSLVKSLEHARPDTAVSIVGAGSRAFAIAYIANDGNTAIQRVAVDGTFSNVWHWNGAVVPSLAWAKDKLFVAMPSRDAWVLDLPR